MDDTSSLQHQSSAEELTFPEDADSSAASENSDTSASINRIPEQTGNDKDVREVVQVKGGTGRCGANPWLCLSGPAAVPGTGAAWHGKHVSSLLLWGKGINIPLRIYVSTCPNQQRVSQGISRPAAEMNGVGTRLVSKDLKGTAR